MIEDKDYAAFLRKKALIAPPRGFEPSAPFPKLIKPFQKDIVTWACRRGRAAVFAGTGLGKTIQELSWARHVIDHTGGQVLIFAPLAVAEQIVQVEAPKFGFGDEVSYAKDENDIRTPIVVTNYDRHEKFDLSQFAGIALDESGILKSQDGKTRMALTDACKETPYLLCASATPAPNDWTELGQHSEFLSVMSAQEMLAMVCVHDGSLRAHDAEDWRLKRHAEKDFWRWLASWSVMIRHPRDLGYEDAGYDLPPLTIKQVTVKAEYKSDGELLFPMEAQTLQERIRARKNSASERVAAAAEIVATEPNEPWLIWCNLNSEADELRKIIPGAVNVQGSDTQEYKTANLLGFTRRQPRVLISKPSIAGHGMNFQHANRMVFVGLTDSFEQVFQAIRRCWRFGQTRETFVYMIAGEMEGAVVANLTKKEKKYEHMAKAMADHMKDICAKQLRGADSTKTVYNPKVTMKVPSWLQSQNYEIRRDV